MADLISEKTGDGCIKGVTAVFRVMDVHTLVMAPTLEGLEKVMRHYGVTLDRDKCLGVMFKEGGRLGINHSNVPMFTVGYKNGRDDIGMYGGPYAELECVLADTPTDDMPAYVFLHEYDNGDTKRTPVFRWSKRSDAWVRMNSHIILDDDIPF